MKGVGDDYSLLWRVIVDYTETFERDVLITVYRFTINFYFIKLILIMCAQMNQKWVLLLDKNVKSYSIS